MGSPHALAPEISAGQPLLLPPSYFLLFSLPAARNADVPVGNTGASYFILSMISDILASPEGKQLEFKRDLSSPTPILKTLVAFANSAGGRHAPRDPAPHPRTISLNSTDKGPVRGPVGGRVGGRVGARVGARVAGLKDSGRPRQHRRFLPSALILDTLTMAASKNTASRKKEGQES